MSGGSLKLPIHNGEPPKSPQNPDYLLGQIVADLRALNKKVDDLSEKLDAHNARFEKMEKAIDGLIAWRSEHMKKHEDDEENIKISKTTFWGLVAAIIASGILIKIIEGIKGALK